jgi:hypothetical protein
MAIVSVPRGGRGMSRSASLSCQRAASTDALARKTGLATIRKPIRTTRATRLNGVDRAGVNAAVEPCDTGTSPMAVQEFKRTPISRLFGRGGPVLASRPLNFTANLSQIREPRSVTTPGAPVVRC